MGFGLGWVNIHIGYYPTQPNTLILGNGLGKTHTLPGLAYWNRFFRKVQEVDYQELIEENHKGKKTIIELDDESGEERPMIVSRNNMMKNFRRETQK